MPSPQPKFFNETASGAKAKRLQEAVLACHNVLKTSPRDVTTMHALGLIECHLGNLAAGAGWLEKALAINPAQAETMFHYGLALLEQKNLPGAIAAFTKAREMDPKNAEIPYNLGMALNNMGKVNEAIEAYKQAVELRPDYVEALNNLGNIYNNMENFKDAVDCYHRAIKAKPDYVMPYNNMGLTLVNLGKLDEAENYYRHAISIMPDYPEAHNNLGIVFRMRGQFEQSVECLKQALSYRGTYHEALNNLGNAYKDLGAMQRAVYYYEKAIKICDTPDYRHNMALALLATGKLREGFKAYESRWETKQLRGSAKKYNVPEWRGEESPGKTLLISHEQGFGDTLQFCRFVPMVKQLGLRVVLEVPPPLKRIIGSLEGVDQVVTRGEMIPPFDLHCPMMSLPVAFQTKLETIPFNGPYLKADPAAVAAWAEKLPPTEGKLRVGLVWAGSSRIHSPDLVATDKRRSMSPEQFVPLLNVPNVQFFSLQKIGTPMPAEHNVIDLMEECNDFADTAALVANLDLVISVDTAMAHLVGALGKPVWMPNRYDSCWRWLQEREDSPWYPTLRQFRQPEAGAWGPVMERVRDELVTLAKA